MILELRKTLLQLEVKSAPRFVLIRVHVKRDSKFQDPGFKQLYILILQERC